MIIVGRLSPEGRRVGGAVMCTRWVEGRLVVLEDPPDPWDGPCDVDLDEGDPSA